MVSLVIWLSLAMQSKLLATKVVDLLDYNNILLPL